MASKKQLLRQYEQIKIAGFKGSFKDYVSYYRERNNKTKPENTIQFKKLKRKLTGALLENVLLETDTENFILKDYVVKNIIKITKEYLNEPI